MFVNYEYYRVFYYVAKYKNFTKAAEALLNNQPNVTRSIKNLETALGCVLFVRSNRGVTLTPEGEKLFAHISIANEEIQAGEQELSLNKSLQSGTISIAATETALHGLLLSVLNRFHQAYPGVRIRISNHSTPQALNALKNGTADIAVVTTPADIKRPLQEYPLKAFQEIPVCGASLLFLTNRRVSLKELLEYPFICLGKDTKTYEFYNRLFLSNGCNLSPDMEVATIDQVLPLVKNQLGIGFLPEEFARPAIENGEIFELKLVEKIPERQICMVKRTDHPFSIAAGTFETMLLGEQGR